MKAICWRLALWHSISLSLLYSRGTPSPIKTLSSECWRIVQVNWQFSCGKSHNLSLNSSFTKVYLGAATVGPDNDHPHRLTMEVYRFLSSYSCVVSRPIKKRLYRAVIFGKSQFYPSRMNDDATNFSQYSKSQPSSHPLYPQMMFLGNNSIIF